MPVLPFYQFELKDKLNSKPQCFDSFNFLFLLQGTGTIRCRNQLIHLKPHDFTFFNMYEIHQFLTFSPDARVCPRTSSLRARPSSINPTYSLQFRSLLT